MQSTVTRFAQIAEAETRLKILGVFDEVQRQFQEHREIYYSTVPHGVYFLMNDKDLQEVKEFEEKYNVLVYTAIRSAMGDMVLDSLFYVSDSPEEWRQDRDDLRNGRAFVQVLNRDYPKDSELGYIYFKMGIGGGLIRTA